MTGEKNFTEFLEEIAMSKGFLQTLVDVCTKHDFIRGTFYDSESSIKVHQFNSFEITEINEKVSSVEIFSQPFDENIQLDGWLLDIKFLKYISEVKYMDIVRLAEKSEMRLQKGIYQNIDHHLPILFFPKSSVFMNFFDQDLDEYFEVKSVKVVFGIQRYSPKMIFADFLWGQGTV